MKKFNYLLAIMVSSLLTVITLVSGNVLAEVGVTEDSIKIGGTYDLTGASSFSCVPAKKGIELYFRKINDEGGIFGRKLIFVVEDDGYSVSRSVANFKKLVNFDKVFCMLGNSTADCLIAQLPLIEKEKIPVVGPQTHDEVIRTPPKRYVIPVDVTIATDQSSYLLWYIYDKLGQKQPKLGYIWQEGAYGKNGFLAGKAYAEKLGIEISISEMFASGSIDLSSQVLKVRMAGIEHLILVALPRAAAAAIKEVKRIGWKPRIYLFSGPVDTPFVSIVGEDGLWPEKVIGVRGYPLPYEDDVPAIREMKELIKRYDPEYTPTAFTGTGIAYAKVMVEGLKRAGKDLTREGLIKAFETFRDYDTGLTSPVTYTPTIRGGHGKCRVYELKKVNGEIKWVVIEKWAGYKEF